LIQAKNILQGIEDLKFVFFSKLDVVRHRLVQDIIDAYEQLEAEKGNDQINSERAPSENSRSENG
jgi:phosphate starvation-inducible PhoH-like protein